MTSLKRNKTEASHEVYFEGDPTLVLHAMVRPNRAAMNAVILLICAVTGLFAISVVVLRDHPSLAAIVAGEGSVLFALVGLAIVLARGHFAAVEKYNEHLADAHCASNNDDPSAT